MAVEVTVANPTYRSDRGPQLAQLLRTAETGDGPTSVGDPTGRPPDPERTLAIVDPGVLGRPASRAGRGPLAGRQDRPGTENAVPAEAAGAASGGPERLTMTVEEAAAALGISRAFAYEAVTRYEIPHVRIGRRILIPRAVLQRMLEGGSEP